MPCYLINTMPSGNEDYVFLDAAPTDTDEVGYRMSVGRPMGAEYPPNARMFCERHRPGVELPDLVGNTRDLLILSKRVKDRLEQAAPGPVEYLPLSIINHKKRLASADYFIVNPLGTVDCLDLDRSEIDWFEGDVVRIKKYVLDPAKLRNAPELFRIRENPRTYVITQALAARLLPPTPTNFFVHPIEE